MLPFTGSSQTFSVCQRIGSSIVSSGAILIPHPSFGTDTYMEPSNQLRRKIAMRECYADHDACVTIIDDERINIEVVKAYLAEAGFSNFRSTTDSRTALNLIEEHAPDIILLDINMPHISGLEILESLRKDERFHRLPVLILTAADDPAVKLRALGLGATDFLAKPVDPSELALRMENVLAAKAYQDQLAKHSEILEEMVRERTRELEESRREAIHCLAKAGEYRDDDTGQHVTRVGRYTRIIATELGFPPKDIELLEQAAKLHDLGKIGIPDAILHKAGKLEPEEYQIIQQHCGIGCEIMNPSNEDDASTMRQHATIGPKILSSTRCPCLNSQQKLRDRIMKNGTAADTLLASEVKIFQSRVASSRSLTSLTRLVHHALTKMLSLGTNASKSLKTVETHISTRRFWMPS
ncbi:MAG: response regulator [Rubripirellula sp.]|nr:response regulator [Rubripirellula sp.]